MTMAPSRGSCAVVGYDAGSVLVITSVPNAQAPSSWAAYTALESPMCCIAAAPAVFGWKTACARSDTDGCAGK